MIILLSTRANCTKRVCVILTKSRQAGGERVFDISRGRGRRDHRPDHDRAQRVGHRDDGHRPNALGPFVPRVLRVRAAGGGHRECRGRGRTPRFRSTGATGVRLVEHGEELPGRQRPADDRSRFRRHFGADASARRAATHSGGTRRSERRDWTDRLVISVCVNPPKGLDRRRRQQRESAGIESTAFVWNASPEGLDRSHARVSLGRWTTGSFRGRADGTAATPTPRALGVSLSFRRVNRIFATPEKGCFRRRLTSVVGSECARAHAPSLNPPKRRAYYGINCCQRL